VMLRPPKNTVTSSDVAASKEHSHIKWCCGLKRTQSHQVMLRPQKNTVTSSDVAASKEHSHIK
jgi:hypothetical protein